MASIVFVALCSAASTGPANAQSKAGQEHARRLLDEGISLLQKDDWENACSKLRESVALDPTPTTRVEIAKCNNEADRLFRLGAELLEKQDFKTACPHFERSMRLDPSAGTQVNIAVCLVRRDQNYSAACLAYQEARRMNRSEKDEAKRAQREADISKDLKEISQHLPKLHIHVSRRPGLLVTVDGNRIDDAVLGNPFPICTGERVVEASALDQEPQTHTIRVAGTETKHLKLELRPRLTTPPGPIAPPPDPGRSQRIAGTVVGGIGLVGVGVTIGLAVNAVSKYNAYVEACPDGMCPSDQVRMRFRGEAEESRDVAIAVGTISGVMLVTGIVLYATAPATPTSPPQPQVTLRLSPTGATLEGRW